MFQYSSIKTIHSSIKELSVRVTDYIPKIIYCTRYTSSRENKFDTSGEFILQTEPQKNWGEDTHILQSPGRMGCCDVIISRQNFDKGVSEWERKGKQVKACEYWQNPGKATSLWATYFPPNCVTTLWSTSSVPARLSVTSTPAGPRRWPLLRIWTTETPISISGSNDEGWLIKLEEGPLQLCHLAD